MLVMEIHLTTNNLDCTVSNIWSNAQSLNGIYSEAKKLIVTVCRIFNSGVAGMDGNRNGIAAFLSDSVVVSGNIIGNTGGVDRSYMEGTLVMEKSNLDGK